AAGRRAVGRSLDVHRERPPSRTFSRSVRGGGGRDPLYFDGVAEASGVKPPEPGGGKCRSGASRGAAELRESGEQRGPASSIRRGGSKSRRDPQRDSVISLCRTRA